MATLGPPPLDEPFVPPPPGVTVNLIDPTSLVVPGRIILGLAVGISTLAVGVRIFARCKIAKQVLLEDYLIVAGWLAEVAYLVPCELSLTSGSGRHIWDITWGNFVKIQYYINVATIIYGPAVSLIKVAILLQIVRVFAPIPRLNRTLFVSSWALVVVTVIFYIINTVFQIIQCSPREKIWNPFVPGHCFKGEVWYKATGLFNVITDFATLLLPQYTIYKLHMRPKKKAAIMAVFATGLCACVSSIVRTYFTWILYHRPDKTWYATALGWCTLVEMAIGIIVFCLPVVPQVYQYWEGKAKIYGSSWSAHKSSRGASAEYEEADSQKLQDSTIHLTRVRTAVSDGVHHSSLTGDSELEGNSQRLWSVETHDRLEGKSGV